MSRFSDAAMDAFEDVLESFNFDEKGAAFEKALEAARPGDSVDTATENARIHMGSVIANLIDEFGAALETKLGEWLKNVADTPPEPPERPDVGFDD